MGLLAPWFLAGALAVALPVWLHRLQTQSAERQPFSSTMLLETTEQRVHVRRRLRYLLLLTLRILLLALIALAFAQPFLERRPNAAGASGTWLVVVDTSASMGRSGVFQQALEESGRVIDAAPQGMAVLIAAAAGSLRQLGEPGIDRSVARRALDNLEPTALRTDAGQMAEDVSRLAATLPQPVTLHFVSDFQASAMPARFADTVPAGIARFEPHPVGTGDPVNWGVTGIMHKAGAIEVTVHAWGLTDLAADVELTINEVSQGVRSVTGSGTHVLRFDEVSLDSGDNRVIATLAVDDDLAIDNRYFAVVTNEPPVQVPLLAVNPGGLPATYLSAALTSAAGNGYEVHPYRIADFDPRVLSRYRWAIVDDLLALEPPLENAIRDYLARGGNLLAFAGSPRPEAEILPVGGQRIAPATLASRPDDYRSIGNIDTRHPALAGAEGWHRVNVGPGLRIEAGEQDRVLARLDDGAPYILEQRVGDGLLLTVLDPLDNRASDLPVLPVFVGFMLDTAVHLQGQAARETSVITGDTLSPGAGGGQVVAPDGSTLLTLEATARPRPVRADAPGIYHVYSGERDYRVAVNVDPRESDLDAIRQGTLELWRDSTRAGTGVGVSALVPDEPLRVDLWPWLLLVMAVAAIAEALLANHHLATRIRVYS